MPAAFVPMVIDQGEDYTSDVIWTDNYDEPLPVQHPCRLDIKSLQGQTLLTLESDPLIPDGEIPSIAVSTEVGLLQLHITEEITASMVPGEHHYDLFVTVDDGSTYAGAQVQRICYGPVTVNKRITQM